MNIKYFSQGSLDESDGLTVSQAMFDEDDNFLYGDHSTVTVAAIEAGTKVSLSDYAVSFYKSKEITEDEFRAFNVTLKDNSKRGHVGIVSTVGRDVHQNDIVNHNQFIQVERIKGLQPLADEVEAMANMMGNITDAQIMAMYKVRGLKDESMIGKVRGHNKNQSERDSNSAKTAEAEDELKKGGHDMRPVKGAKA